MELPGDLFIDTAYKRLARWRARAMAEYLSTLRRDHLREVRLTLLVSAGEITDSLVDDDRNRGGARRDPRRRGARELRRRQGAGCPPASGRRPAEGVPGRHRRRRAEPDRVRRAQRRHRSDRGCRPAGAVMPDGIAHLHDVENLVAKLDEVFRLSKHIPEESNPLKRKAENDVVEID